MIYQRMKEFEFEEKLMNCDFFVSLIGNNEEKARAIFNKSLELGKLYESKFSRFDPNSELSQLNRKRNLVVSNDFIEILKLSIKAHEETAGSFNPLLQVEKIGYDKSFEKMDKPGKVDIKKYNINISEIEIDELKREVRLAPEQKLDFGGILKGIVTEKMSHLAKDFAGSIFNLGGDIRVSGYDEKGGSFTFSIFNPVNKTEIDFSETNCSIATSGTYKRTWQLRESKYSHILSPQTLLNPKNKIVSATIISDSGYLSEAFAKLAIINSIDETLEIITKKRLKAVLIKDNGGVIKIGI